MLLKMANLVKNHYKKILIIAVLFTVLCGYWISKLKLNMQFQDMLPETSPEVVMYMDAMENFTGLDMISIVIEGNEKDIINYIEDVRHKLIKVDDVEDIIYKSEEKFLKKHGLLLAKKKELESMEGFLTASSIRDFVKGLNDNFEKEYIDDGDSKKISNDSQQMLAMFNTVEDFLNMLQSKNSTKSQIQKTSNEFLIGPKYMISGDRSMGLMFIKTPLSIVEIDKIIPLVNNTEKIVKENQEKYNVKAGLSGYIVLQRDEMAATERDMTVSFILSIILIGTIFLIGFKLFRYTILALIPLLLGVVWAMGLTYVFIGSLNPFTAMMGAILIGLGIDYAIHVISLYTEERYKGTPVNDAITKVYEKSVKGIITGSVTTAIGFVMFAFSSFPAFREFGITLGTGIISTLLASIFILPSLLMIFGKKDVRRPETTSPIAQLYKKIILNHPHIMIAIVVVLLGLSAMRFNRIAFSKDIKDIEPKGLESLELNDKMIEKFDFSIDTTMGITKTIDEAYELTENADELDTVGMVESIATYIPAKNEMNKRLKALRKIKRKVSPSVDQALHISELKKELKRLNDNIIELSDLAYMGAEHKLVDRCDELVNTGVIKSAAENVHKHTKNLKKVQNIFIKNLKNTVLNANSERAIRVDDLSKNIRDRYIGKDGTYMTTIYSKGDVWTDEFQPLYIAELKSIGKPLTGSTLLSLEVMGIAAREGTRILFYVVLCIFAVLLIDFRSIKYATFAMLPMVLTLMLLIGIMVWFNIKFDYVNVIALPIIIGIGVDDGVHLLHRYLIEKKLMPTIISTGRAILLTTLTTIAAFGTMIFSTYQGFASYGRLLIFGIGLSYILTILLVSSLIKMVDKVNE